MRTRRLLTLAGLALGPVLVLVVFFVLPVSGMVGRGFVVDGRFDPGGVVEVLGRSRTHRVLWFTVWSAGLATLASVVLGLPAAYVLYRLSFPLRDLIRALLLVPFVLPTVVVGVAFRLLIADSGPLGPLNLDGTPVAIVAGLTFFNVAVVIRAVGTAWESLDPRPGEAAAALGASPAQVFRTVTLPTLRPALVGAASVVFLFCATSFGVVLTLGGLRYSSVETEIYLLTTQLLDLPAAAALSILQLLAITALLVLVGRLRAVPDPTVARRTARPRRPGRQDAVPVAITGLVLALVAAPILTLLVGSLRADDAWTLANYQRLTTVGEGNALLVPVTDALVISLRTAVDATWMALLLGGLIAVVVSRRSVTGGERRLRSSLDGFFMLPLGVSAVTLGFGFLITLDRPPLSLRDSPLLVPVAQALVALPLVVRTLVPVLGSIDDRQRQAAASLGAGPLRAFATVDLPLVWRPLLAAAGFAFAVSLGEFGATSFLARDEHPTLPVVIYQLIGRPGGENFGMALAASVVLAATTALVVLAVDRFGGRSLGEGLMLALSDVTVAYDGVPAVRDASLELPDGQVLAVLGPSGCGKSTLLRAVAGLEPLSGGDVMWDSAAISQVPTHKRGFALMFQDGQLFHHLTVARNVGYALRLRRASGADARVEELLALVGLEGYADRLPATLSGGERQRVALARCLAVRPRLLLLDEPLSALDAGLRQRLATDLRRILTQERITALMVTHDHEEAFTVADRLAVMRAGEIVQQGAIDEVWRAPADPQTALFLGYARVLEGLPAGMVRDAMHPRTPFSTTTASRTVPPERLAVRRSAFRVDPEGALSGTVTAARTTPQQVRLVVDLEGVGEVDAVAPLDQHPGVGEPVRLAVDATRTAPVGG